MPIANYLIKAFNTLNQSHKILPENENNDDLTTYIRCMFHDLRGPLNNISLGIDIVMSTIPKNDDNSLILTTVKESCLFLSDSLDSFLNIKAIKNDCIDMIEIKYDPFNIEGLIYKVLHILKFNAIKKHIEIKYTSKNIKEWVIGDSKKIQHVLMNLLSNAIKFSLNNSAVYLELECINIINQQQHILITVVDNNPFIAQNIKEKLFEKYNTSDNTQGTGLGLNICKKIIELHKGIIRHHYNGDVEIIGEKQRTMDNVGNIFQIQLFLDICPTSEADINFDRHEKSNILSSVVNNTDTNECSIHSKAEDNDENKINMIKCIKRREIDKDSSMVPSENNRQCLKNSRRESIRKFFSDSFYSNDNNIINVMVIDDSEVSRKLMIKLIENNCSNIKVFSADDGLNALLKIVGFKDKIEQHLSIIFVDNVMPNITGELLCKILRGIGYTGLIMGITGNGLEQDKQSFLENGADYVFVKPFTKNKLTQILEFIQKEGFVSKDEEFIVEKNGKLIWSEG